MVLQKDKLIVCVAPVGSLMKKDRNPNMPIQPEEIADEVYRAWNEGASIVHLHARDVNGNASTDPKVFQEIDRLIREKGCDIIIQHSTSSGRGELGVEEGARSLEADPEMGTVDIGMLVMVQDGKERFRPWTRSFIRESLLKPMLTKGIKPELEVYTPGGLEEINVFAEEQLLKEPYWISFVLDMHRTLQNTVRYSPKNLLHYVELLPKNSMFTVASIAATELPAAIQAILLGGHVRVGFEDNLWLRKGVLAESNAQLVARVANIARELGREPATPKEARELLGIPQLKN